MQSGTISHLLKQRELCLNQHILQKYLAPSAEPKSGNQAATSDEDSDNDQKQIQDQIIQGDVGGSHRGSGDKRKAANWLNQISSALVQPLE